MSTLLIFVLSIEILNLKLRKDEKLWCMTWLLFMSWLNITSLLSHQTHLFAMFQQISTLSVISLSGCHIIGSITVATARNAASPPGALNFISSPEGCAGWGGCRPLSEPISPSRHHWLLHHQPSAACIHCRPGVHFTSSDTPVRLTEEMHHFCCIFWMLLWSVLSIHI